MKSPDPVAPVSREDPSVALALADARTLDLLLNQAVMTRGTHRPEWTAAYVQTFIGFLRKCSVEERYLEPLRLIGEQYAAAAEQALVAEAPPPETLEETYCAAAAEISWLIRTGLDEHTAARKVARRLIGEGHPLPERGGDSRGWMRLLMWREKLRTLKRPEALYSLYQQRLDAMRRPEDETPG